MKTLLILLTTLTILSGCASSPKMEEFANDPEGMWEQGKKYAEKGEKLIIDGEKALEASRKQLREGEAMIQSGSDAIIKARQDYQLEVTRIGGSSSPKEIEYEAERLQAIGERWEDAIESVKKGNALVAKSKANQTKAQQKIKEGREIAEIGANFIRNSQRMKLNLPLLDAPESMTR
ncbi:hypothetical protein [Brumicola blandensis]|uniref:DUF4398 domain-containing protein n=1 Tax=Brumicola blandensis TaxID=3075611 RepID=A0AAW8R002_9ALTE|nr:hypothetical protein [Alteromonas sp. W409]MDT0581527.1 hypothetical protein [Alteromonas sp. W409]